VPHAHERSFVTPNRAEVNVFAVAEAIVTRPVERRVPKFVIAVMLALTVMGTGLAIWEALAPFVPHEFYPVMFDETGRVTRTFPAELPPGVPVARGDQVIERPQGDIERGYRLQVPRAGDVIHVAARGGVVTLRAQPAYYPRGDAIGEALRHTTGAVIIIVAGLLFLRRPGVMAFAFWIWAISELGGSNLNVALETLPRTVALIASLVILPLFAYSGLALISFALRFPSDRVPAGLRWLDVTAWATLAALLAVVVVEGCQYYAGYRAPFFWSADLLIPELGLFAAVAILLWKRSRSDTLERSRIAWASVAFMGAGIARSLGLAIAVAPFGLFADQHLSWRLLVALSNLCPLLAVYPILRYRLFDIGFVVNRATLYSILTLAAFGTLAAVNWVANHFVTDRLAFVLQPIAAVAIGLGYFRVRKLVQQIIERVLFRDRYAAEERLEATIRGLGFVERSASVDEVLVVEVSRTLRLASAAMFRLTSERFERGPAVGWHDAGFSDFARDDSLARALQADGPLVLLRTADWRPASLPLPPEDPAFALGIIRRGVLSAIVLYGRHANGTEVEPEELALIRRTGAAAALAYETAEVATLRERNQILEERLQRLNVEVP
jgi:hypothetical protein